MTKVSVSNPFTTLSILILSLGEISVVLPQRRIAVKQFQPFGTNIKQGPPVVCTHDSLIVYSDCRMCVCPRPNRLAKCFQKNCDLRTKDSGQCPPAILNIDFGRTCAMDSTPTCRVDDHCPGNKLCCFDFCGMTKCADPIPLDSSTGMSKHNGRAYKHTL